MNKTLFKTRLEEERGMAKEREDNSNGEKKKVVLGE